MDMKRGAVSAQEEMFLYDENNTNNNQIIQNPRLQRITNMSIMNEGSNSSNSSNSVIMSGSGLLNSQQTLTQFQYNFQQQHDGVMPSTMEIYSQVSTPDPFFNANSITRDSPIMFVDDNTGHQFRSRHDSYSSSIYSPGPSSIHVVTSPEDSYHMETNNQVAFQDNYENSNMAPDQSMGHGASGEEDLIVKKENKEKCMSKNAVLARANRLKKKTEAKVMGTEIEQLKAEKATLQERIAELEKQLADSEANNKFYRGLLQNSKEIGIILQHVDKSKVLPD